jgi:cytochrome c peroxidase
MTAVADEWYSRRWRIIRPLADAFRWGILKMRDRGTQGFALPVLIVIAAGCLAAMGLALVAQAQAQEGVPSAKQMASMRADYRRPPPRPVENQALVDLGRSLFWDPRSSASGKTSCASCHFPHLGWATTDAKSRNDSGKLTSRRSQTVLALGHTAGPIGWDGRSATLEAQARSSIATGSMSMSQTETPVKVEAIEERIRAVPEYVAKFNAAWPGAAIDLDGMAKAIAAYERTIEPGVAPFDRWIEGDESAIPDAAKRGFVLFNGKAECSLCHSGWRFTNDTFHDIGVSTKDLGRGREVKDEPLMQYAFKTPTLRSVALHAPYMHDGSAADLHQVVKHYEKGGIDRPSRSPLIKPIALTDQERSDLVAFMEALTGEGEAVAAPKLP